MKFIKSLIIILLISCSIYSQSVTMYQVNLQHGQGTDGGFDYGRQVAAFSDGDIIAVQERGTGDTGWNSALASFGITEAVYRENSTLADGNAIWIKSSNVTVNATFSGLLSSGFTGGGFDVDKSVACADVTVSSRRFTVCSTHLCWSACSDAQRIDQLNALLAFRNSTLPAGRDVLFLGDFNFPPSLTSHYNLLTANYVDLWQDGINKSIATANWGDRDTNGIADMIVDSNSITHDTRRIDYGWLNKSPITLVLSSISLPDTRATCPHGLVVNGGSLPACTPEVTQLWDVTGDFGVKPTDHNITKFVFTFTTVKKCRFHTNPSCQ